MTGGRNKPSKVGNAVVHAPGHQADVPQLLQQVDAEPPGDAVEVTGVGKVGPARLVEDLSVAVVHHRKAEPDHLFVVDRAAVHRPQGALDAHHRRTADLEMQIAAFELDHGPEQLVDLQFLLLGREPRSHLGYAGGLGVFVSMFGGFGGR